MPLVFQKMRDFTRRYERRLWWLHSAYALLIGIGVMWLGSRDYLYLRVVVFHIAFIWLSSLFLPVILKHPRLGTKWGGWLQVAVNYLNKNFFQQILFFILPIYWSSTTFPSLNVLFVIALAVSAVLSTMDIVYDRYLSVRWNYLAVFFAFNLFACINVMLPVLWSIGHHLSAYISAAVALVVFATFGLRLSGLDRKQLRFLLIVSGLFLLALAELGRPLIPPAPLRLVSAEFRRPTKGRIISKPEREFQYLGSYSPSSTPMDVLPADYRGNLYVLTYIYFPLGLTEHVRHVWYVGGSHLFSSKDHDVTGGRKEGFRLWTFIKINTKTDGSYVRVDVETDGGQLVGRVRLPAGEAGG